MRERVGRVEEHGQREIATKRKSCEGPSEFFGVYEEGRLNPRDEIL